MNKRQLNGGASFRWLFGPHSAWGRLYRANNHPYHAPQFSMNLNLSKLPVISDLRSEILSYECECRYWFNENTHLHRQCNYVTRQNIIQKRQYEVLRKRCEFLSTKIKDQGMAFFKVIWL